MDQEVVDLKVAVATLIVKVETLSKILEKQDKTIEDLVALANKGKGSIWLLMGVGSVLGFLFSKIGPLLSYFIR